MRVRERERERERERRELERRGRGRERGVWGERHEVKSIPVRVEELEIVLQL